MIFKSRKGLFQAKKYNKRAKEFWKIKEQEMIDEITQLIKSSSDGKLLEISRYYTKKISFPELQCNWDEIREFRRVMKVFGENIIIPDFVRYGTRTGFLTVVIAPALAAAEGIGNIDEKIMNEWLYGIGICLPVSADICDSVLDKEVLKHPLIPYRTWIICHKLGAAILFYIGLKHIKNMKTGKKNIDGRIRKRLKEGLKNICKKQRVDLKVKKLHYVPLSKLDDIYDGKICEIEATVFGTIPSRELDIVKTFEEGARFFAGELQVADDIEDLLGDVNIGKSPEIPNPSYFLTHCIDLWNEGERDTIEIMKKAAKRTLKKGEEYHAKVIGAYKKLPKKFPTRQFFEITLWYHNKVLKNKVKQFLKGRTYLEVRPELLKILRSL